ncbi:MAG: dihydropteroate synthase [Fluviibacter sp.]
MTDNLIPCGAHTLSWSLGRPLVMGIVNVTPDSFSGDGLGKQTDAAFNQALAMMAAGADLLDIGAESTRPGAAAVAADEELNRLAPLLERLLAAGIPTSVDTYKAVVMAEAIKLGAGLINDISALGDPAAAAMLAPHTNVAVCLMHMQGEPHNMQQQPTYAEVVSEVSDFLAAAVLKANAAGIALQRLVLDPGFGFGKQFAHNQALFRALPQFVQTGLPVLVGVSRKTMIGHITDKPVAERVTGSVAAAMLAAQQGAAIVRVHDVVPTVDALKVLRALGPQP